MMENFSTCNFSSLPHNLQYCDMNKKIYLTSFETNKANNHYALCEAVNERSKCEVVNYDTNLLISRMKRNIAHNYSSRPFKKRNNLDFSSSHLLSIKNSAVERSLVSGIAPKSTNLPFYTVPRYSASYPIRKLPYSKTIVGGIVPIDRFISPSLGFSQGSLPLQYFLGGYSQTHALLPQMIERSKSLIATTRESEVKKCIARIDSLKEDDAISRSEEEEECTVDSYVSNGNNSSAICMLLSLEEDKNKISALQCFLRKQIEIFSATNEDVNTHSRGRNRPIEVFQVGIRCKHCCVIPLKDRAKGSCYFPSTLNGIYQTAQNMYHHHFQPGCPYFLSDERDTFFNKSLSCRSSSRCGKDYWRAAAAELGLAETPSGLRFKSQIEISMVDQETNVIDPCTLEILELASRDENNIINHQDRNLVTDYIFILISQMRPCVKSDCTNEFKIPGLMCKYCKGVNGYGLFFRSKVSSLSKNENLAQIEKHLHECHHCPQQIKKALIHLKPLHKSQMKEIKRGNKKIFFSNLMANISKTVES